MAKHIILISLSIWLLIGSVCVFADPFNNQSDLGDEVQPTKTFNDVWQWVISKLTPASKENNDVAANTPAQGLTKEAVYELQKGYLMEQTVDGWRLIVAFFKIIIEVVKLLVFLIEMRLILYVFFNLIPDFFVKIRDGLIRWYSKKN